MRERKYTKEDYRRLGELYRKPKHKWLLDRKEALYELIYFCDNDEQKKLIFQLLKNFHFLNQKMYNFLLEQIAQYIIHDSGFTENTTQLVSMTYDRETDSGQKILYELTNVIWKEGWKNLQTASTIGNGIKNYNKKGLHQILIIDEFIGSGQTLQNQIDDLKRKIKNEDLELKCCFIAGMKRAIDKICTENDDVSCFCSLPLPHGISDAYNGDELVYMLELEEKLASQINKHNIDTFAFGYGEAEALYSLEGCQGNTPNSVFPIFWWPQDYRQKKT